MNRLFPIEQLRKLPTPFYYYDLALLRKTLLAITDEVAKYENFEVHYAIKANTNPKVLSVIRESGLGADCVSGGEVRASLEAGFPADKIVYAGVGKDDWEINLGLDNDILCFNVESIPELEAINAIAESKGKVADVAFRVNPNVDAHTHKYITTGLSENKFGINMEQLPEVLGIASAMKNINVVGLHFHIGSQITELEPFEKLCTKVNELQCEVEKLGVKLKIINVGGGLGIDYVNPDENPITSFKEYFDIFK